MAMMWRLVKLARLLQPEGRAFKIPFGGPAEKLYKAIMSDNLGGLGKAWTDGNQILNDILPDNPNFTIEMAREWYRKLRLYDSGSVSFDDMKLAIAQKMSWAMTPLETQNYLFIENQLRAAGFDVRVYPNKFPDGSGGWITKTPADILGVSAGSAYYGEIYYGEAEYGEDWASAGITLCVNYLEEEKDATFSIAGEYKQTFFIAGSAVDVFAEIPEARKIEFRQLLLQLKEQHAVAFLFVNYI